MRWASSLVRVIAVYESSPRLLCYVLHACCIVNPQARCEMGSFLSRMLLALYLVVLLSLAERGLSIA